MAWSKSNFVRVSGEWFVGSVGFLVLLGLLG